MNHRFEGMSKDSENDFEMNEAHSCLRIEDAQLSELTIGLDTLYWAVVDQVEWILNSHTQLSDATIGCPLVVERRHTHTDASANCFEVEATDGLTSGKVHQDRQHYGGRARI